MTDFEIETAIQTAYHQGWNDSRDSMSSQMRIDEAVEKATIELREKLAAAEEKRDMWLRIAQRLFKERQTMLHGHVYDLPTDDVILEATILEAIIDGKEANETT